MRHRSRSHILIIALLLLPCLWSACTSECMNNQSSIGLAGFYDASTGKEISVNSIQVYGVGAPNDSNVLSTSSGISQVYLPMPIEGSSCGFVIHYTAQELSDPALNDTLTMYYDAIPYFSGVECGAMYKYKIHDFVYTRHVVDSIAIPTMEINYYDVETIKIYMRTGN